MSAAHDEARTWICARCGVAVSRMDGGSAPLPGNWESTAEGDFCLGCRRERAAEAALAAAPLGEARGDAAKLRRAGIVEFEVRRAPERADNAIARACHTSSSLVAATRRRIEAGSGG